MTSTKMNIKNFTVIDEYTNKCALCEEVKDLPNTLELTGKNMLTVITIQEIKICDSCFHLQP